MVRRGLFPTLVNASREFRRFNRGTRIVGMASLQVLKY